MRPPQHKDSPVPAPSRSGRTGSGAPPTHERDAGLRQLLVWTFVMMVIAVLLAFGLVSLVTHLFDKPL